MELEFTVNFKLGTTQDKKKLAKQLYDLHTNFEKDFENYVSVTLLQVGKNVAALYPTEDFFAKRLTVQQNIRDQLVQECEPRHFAISSAIIIGVRYSTKVKVNMQYRETANQQIAALKHKVQTSQIKAATLIEEAKVVAETKIEQVITAY